MVDIIQACSPYYLLSLNLSGLLQFRYTHKACLESTFYLGNGWKGIFIYFYYSFI